MPKIVYLKDGRLADLISESEKGFIVDPYVTWLDFEGDTQSAPSGRIELVDKVYSTPTVELIEAEYKKVLDRVTEQEKILEDRQDELRKLNDEISKLKNQKTDLSRYIINREELRTAKRLVLWPSNQIAPRIMDGTSSHKFTVSYEITQYKGEERAWCYKLWTDGSHQWSGSECFDAQYGIKTDLTDEEILKLTQERIPRFKKSDFGWDQTLRETDDKWLSTEYIEEKKYIIEQQNIDQLESAKKKVRDAQAILEALEKKLTVS